MREAPGWQGLSVLVYPSRPFRPTYRRAYMAARPYWAAGTAWPRYHPDGTVLGLNRLTIEAHTYVRGSYARHASTHSLGAHISVVPYTVVPCILCILHTT